MRITRYGRIAKTILGDLVTAVITIPLVIKNYSYYSD